jgi:multidrug efflux pump subunit AcrA (membrane-fusion protein)
MPTVGDHLSGGRLAPVASIKRGIAALVLSLMATAEVALAAEKTESAPTGIAVSIVGAIKAVATVALHSRQYGDVIDVFNRDGDAVHNGDVLVKLTNERIIAPISGRLSMFSVKIGDHVRADETLVTIIQMTPIIVDFLVPRDRLDQISQRMVNGKMGVVATPFNGYESVRGTMLSSEPDEKTGMVKARAIFQNDDEAFSPGADCDVMIFAE